MTVSTTTNIVRHTGNGATLTFAFAFQVDDEDHLVVKKQTIATGEITNTYTGSDYTVSGIGDAGGGSITLTVAAPTAAQRLIIMRTVPLTQALNINNQGGFLPETLEAQLDLIQMQIQQLQEQINRCVRLPLGDAAASELSKIGDRDSTYIGFDANGDLILYAI